MKRFLAGLLLLLSVIPARAASVCNASVGSVQVSIAAPADGFLEVGAEKRSFFDPMVPSSNRLLCAYVTPTALAGLTRTAGNLNRYMFIEVSRMAEDSGRELTSADFDMVIASAKQQFGDTEALNRTFQSVEAEMNAKLKAASGSGDVSFGKPVPLGTAFQMKDAYAFAMMTPINSAGGTTKMVMVAVLLRVKSRLVFEYVYARYEDEGSVKWVGQTAESWTRQILAANAN